MTPSNENKNKEFCFLMQMIMEHYFQLYKKKCGHFLVETHCINFSKKKHHYKIGKHICNTYYRLKENSRWNVKCVECDRYYQN